MLHAPGAAALGNIDEKDRGIVAAPVQMDEGAVRFREIPAAGLQRQQVETKAFIDRNALSRGPVAIGG